MRVEILFLRWLLVVSLVALGALYLHSTLHSRPAAPYQTVPLIQGGKSSGMPLAGIVVDPTRRDVTAIVGGAPDAAARVGFFVLWKGNDGETYGTTFANNAGSAGTLCQLERDGRLRPLKAADDAHAADAPGSRDPRLAEVEATLRSVMAVLPNGSSAQ